MSETLLWKAYRVGPHSVDRCPCCGYRTGCTTCPVCFWTDDGQGDQDAEVVRGGPNGDLSLSLARLNFAIYGASHQRYADIVRSPRPDEYP
ncbi:CPCC family cysteine-rich protein [Solwaraspora sp. WMMD791]|uniref:CPCC family cysteine-rich protein n=1 Tax=Solwaraspora sp. WMMD791 TaxID=3016086 RepID=UPI00249B2AF7|nr:CPCC family cysteine-rich protein [Solwaraspora sp. WMMD791]WFE27449.1 CPCC family cysteine-rich protein [Solwaraspora sp. WMMD791]